MNQNDIIISEAQVDDVDHVIGLWQKTNLVRPWNDPHQDCCRALKEQASELFVSKIEGTIIGSVMAGYEGHRGWIYYLAVCPSCQNCGVGKKLYFHAEEWLKRKGAPKIQILIRRDNDQIIDFYKKIGFEVSSSILMGKQL